MPDSEKVIMGLKCLTTNDVPCHECPYAEKDYCTKNIASDALALLKEQEEQLSIKTENFNRLVAKVNVMPKIVRCKDCENNIGGRCRNLDLWVETDPEWFCADGKKKGATALQ